MKTYMKSPGGMYSYDDIINTIATINAEIAAGQAPDILIINSIFDNLESYAQNGVFADLNEMLASSQTLRKEDIVESVVRAFTFDGKLIGLPQYFELNTIYGKTSVVGERNGWTIQDLKEFMNQYPDRFIIEDISKDSMLYSLISFYKDTFIDWENGQCYFDGVEFKELLEFANRFSEPQDPAYFENVEPLLIITPNIRDFRSYREFLAIAQEPVNFIGYPSPNGSRGIGLQVTDGVYTITSQSKHKEGAWAFLEFLLTQEAEGSEHLSVNKNHLENMCTEAMEIPLYTDMQGITHPVYEHIVLDPLDPIKDIIL
jgi:maltose-binding protein MalE